MLYRQYRKINLYIDVYFQQKSTVRLAIRVSMETAAAVDAALTADLVLVIE